MVSLFRKLSFLSLAILICLMFCTHVFLYVHATKGSYPGANGLIAYSDYDPLGSDTEIFVMNSDGTGVTQITFNDVDDFDPCWSPDGGQIAFISLHNIKWSVWAINLDGTGLRQITVTPDGKRDFSPAWSPDGRTILFMRETDLSIFRIDAESTGPGIKFIANAVDPSWSPDGSMIAYHNWTDNNIWVADSTGTPLFRVTNDGGTDPCWSPDWQRIVYSKQDKIWVINLDGSDEEELTNPGDEWEDREPNWSPDGKKILFQREPDSIWIMNPDGTNIYDLTPSRPYAKFPDWQTRPFPVGGEISINSITSFTTWIIVIITTVSLTLGVVFGKKKRL